MKATTTLKLFPLIALIAVLGAGTTPSEAADICIRGVQTNKGAGIQIAFGSSCGAGHYHQAKPVHGAVNLDGTPVKFPPVPNHLPVPVHNQPIGKPIGTWGMFKKS